MFSVHPTVAAGYPNAGFDAYPFKTLSELAPHVTRSVYAACVWAGGKRGAVYYMAAQFCVLDFDESLTKAQAVERLNGLAFLLGPTKSDGVAKGNHPPRDRFRVLVPFERRIYQRDVFEWNMKRTIKRFEADTKPYDGGRIWQPCTSVEMIREGMALDVSTDIPVEETQSYIQDKIKSYVKERIATRTYPKRVSRFLDGETQEGEWNNELFFAACFLFEAGWTVEKVRQLIYTVYPAGGHEKTETTIRSAASRVGGLSF